MTPGHTIHLLDLSKPLSARRHIAHKGKYSRCTGNYQWRVPAVGAERNGRGCYMVDGKLAHGLNLRVSVETRATWRDVYGDFEVFPMLARLPHGRGFLAGCGEGDGMWASFSRTIWTDERDAWAAASDEARDAVDRMIADRDTNEDDNV